MIERATTPSLRELRGRLLRHSDELAHFHVRSLELFGSMARGQARPESDIDILVTFDRPVDFFEFLDLEDYLASLVGRRIDLVPRESIKPSLRERIEKEAVRVY